MTLCPHPKPNRKAKQCVACYRADNNPIAKKQVRIDELHAVNRTRALTDDDSAELCRLFRYLKREGLNWRQAA